MGRTPRYCAGLQAVLEKRGLGALDYGLEAELIEAGVGAPWKVVATRVERSPARSARSLHRAEVEWARGNLDVALRYFRDAAVQDPLSTNAHLRLAQYYSSLGQTGLAILELERVVALSPENVRAWLQLGRLYELQFDAERKLEDWDHAVQAFRKALAPEETRRLQARLGVCRAQSVALSASGDWQVWIPSRRDDYRLGNLVGHWNDDDEDLFPRLEPTQASGALVWRGTRGGSLVWLRSRQPDTRLLRDGKLVLTLGGPRNPGWGKPAAIFRDRGRRSEVLIYPGPSVDLGVEIEVGKVVGILLVEKGRLLREMCDQRNYRAVGSQKFGKT